MLKKVRGRREILLAGFVFSILFFHSPVCLGAQQAPTIAEAVQAPSPGPDMLSTITITINGDSMGDREVGITGDSPMLSRDLLIELLGGYLKPDIYDRVFNVLLGKLAWVAEADLKRAGIMWTWDITHVVLALTVPPSYSPITDIDSAPQYVANIKPILKPTPVSGHLDFDFIAESDISASATSFPLEADLSGTANILGWVAEGAGTFRLADTVFTPSLSVARVTRDFPGINGRLTLGKLTAPGLAYQSQPELYAFSLSSAEIVKYRVKPGFYELFSEFTLEKPSTVRIMLNNAVFRTINLSPGNYRVLDLPLTYGLNDFEIEIEDPDGKITTMRSIIPREMNLLGEGTSDYSITAGVGSVEIGQSLASAYYRYGFLPRFTGGIQAGADLRSAMAGLSFIYASPLGNFTGTGVGVGAWDGRLNPLSMAASLQYRLSMPGGDYIPTIGFSGEYASAGFASPSPSTTVPVPDPTLRIGTQIGGKLSNLMSYSLSGTWSKDLVPSARSTMNASASLNRSLGQGASLSFLFNMMLTEGSTPSFNFTTMLFVLPKTKVGRSLSFIQAGDGTNSVNYADKVDTLGGLDLNLKGSNLMPGSVLGSSMGISGRKAGSLGDLSLSADLDYGSPSLGTIGKISATASTSLAFAGGYFAFTRQLDDSFVLFAPLKGMAAQRVVFKVDGAGTAISENGRPVILPLTSYKPTASYLELPEAPIDITPTTEAALLIPGYKSAIVFTAETQKRYSVTGRLVGASGQPFGYVAGDLVDMSGSNLNSTFTDENGEFELYDLEPGTYTILWPDFVGTSKFEVTAVESGQIELGTVVPEPAEAAAP